MLVGRSTNVPILQQISTEIPWTPGHGKCSEKYNMLPKLQSQGLRVSACFAGSWKSGSGWHTRLCLTHPNTMVLTISAALRAYIFIPHASYHTLFFCFSHPDQDPIPPARLHSHVAASDGLSFTVASLKQVKAPTFTWYSCWAILLRNHHKWTYFV